MNNNPNQMQSASQTKAIIAYLKKGNTITQMQALKLFNCFRLASRISDIKRMGYAIHKVMVKNMENGKHYAQYSIKEG